MIPKMVVEFYGQRHLWVVGIPSPTPFRLLAQWRQMVPGLVIEKVLTSITDAAKRITSAKDCVPRTKDINVRLTSVSGIRCVFRRFGKTFQHEIVDVGRSECNGQFCIRVLDELESQGIVFNVLNDTLTHPVRTKVPALLNERDR